MTIRIFNDSVSLVLRSYACAELDGQKMVVWLEIAPQHPKAVGAIWAGLVNNTNASVRIRDDQRGETLAAYGLRHRYHRLAMDAPSLAGRVRPKFLRLVAPEACQIADLQQPFVALSWPGIPPGTALAAMLEHGTALPVQIGWGDYLLAEAEARGHARPLVTGGPAPAGYVVEPAPWEAIISEGVRAGHITLAGECVRLPALMPQGAEVLQ